MSEEPSAGAEAPDALNAAARRARPRVIVVGAVNVDFVVAAEKLPAPGETVVGEGCERHGGGKGANAAVAASRAGASVTLIGAVGDDDTGARALAELRAAGVEVGAVAVLAGSPTGVALIVVDARGENQIAVGAGANSLLSANWVRASLESRLDATDCVLVSTEIPDAAVLAVVEATRRAGVRCVLNPAPPTDAVFDAIGAQALLTPNATELAAIAAQLKLDSSGEAAKPAGELHDTTVRASALAARSEAPVVVTMGGDGALIASPGDEPLHVAARAARVIDTTGAGDTFNGTLAVALGAGEELEDAVRSATVAAGISVEAPGARGGMPDAATLAAALAPAA
ncbi:MAG: ribokinase [Solirubrobacteraceae bacterium]